MRYFTTFPYTSDIVGVTIEKRLNQTSARRDSRILRTKDARYQKSGQSTSHRRPKLDHTRFLIKQLINDTSVGQIGPNKVI